MQQGKEVNRLMCFASAVIFALAWLHNGEIWVTLEGLK
jgi:hypothetical protein